MNAVTLFLLSLSYLVTNSAFAETSSRCPGETGYYYVNYKTRNPQKGGFVSYSADVREEGDRLYIAPTAAVCGNASIEGEARIYGNAIVRGNAFIYDRTKIYENAIVEGNTSIRGDARIYGNAQISGDEIEISGTPQIYGDAVINGNRINISGSAKINENAKIYSNSTINGTAVVNGWKKVSNQQLSSGVHTAPQFSNDELEAMKRNEQERQRKIALKESHRQSQERLFKSLKSEIAKKETVRGTLSSSSVTILENSDRCNIQVGEEKYTDSGKFFISSKSGIVDLRELTYFNFGFSNHSKDYVYDTYKFYTGFIDAFFAENRDNPAAIKYDTLHIPQIVIKSRTNGKTSEMDLLFSSYVTYENSKRLIKELIEVCKPDSYYK